MPSRHATGSASRRWRACWPARPRALVDLARSDRAPSRTRLRAFSSARSTLASPRCRERRRTGRSRPLSVQWGRLSTGMRQAGRKHAAWERTAQRPRYAAQRASGPSATAMRRRADSGDTLCRSPQPGGAVPEQSSVSRTLVTAQGVAADLHGQAPLGGHADTRAHHRARPSVGSRLPALDDRVPPAVPALASSPSVLNKAASAMCILAWLSAMSRRVCRTEVRAASTGR